MKVITVVYDQAALLPQFLKHYRGLGADRFVIGVYDAGGLALAVRTATRQFDATILPIAGGYHPDTDRDFALNAARQFVGPKEWWAIADIDEFHEYPAPLSELVPRLEDQGAAFLVSRLLDRVTADGSCPPLDPGRPLWEQFPAAASITRSMNRLDERKVLLVRGHQRFVGGHHDAADEDGRRRRATGGIVHHFKWHGDVVERTRRKRQTARAHGLAYHANLDWFLSFWDAHRRMPIAGEFGFHFPPKPPGWQD